MRKIDNREVTDDNIDVQKKTVSRKSAILIVVGLVALLAAAITVTILLGGGGTVKTASTDISGISGTKVVIDAGHGGSDAGAIGASGTEEAGLNLKIALRLKADLEAGGATVIMTRSDKNAIAPTKEGDMEKRREIISTSGQDVTISIHQNHYEDESVSGPQVFYAPGSVKGKQLAADIQARLNSDLAIKSPRTETEGNYYITKSGSAPCVIVECGFISNPTEEKLLKKDTYQIMLVKAIVEGYADFMNTSASEG